MNSGYNFKFHSNDTFPCSLRIGISNHLSWVDNSIPRIGVKCSWLIILELKKFQVFIGDIFLIPYISMKPRIVGMIRICTAIFLCYMLSISVYCQDQDSIAVTSTHFNQGLILSLPQAIQGQIPGLMISRPGANPNGEFGMIYRGYHTFRNRMQPLLMVDGMPGISWHLVDPFLMDSVSVRRGSQLVQMGMQAGAGVFDATFTNPENTGLSVTLLQNVSVENYQRPYDNLSAAEFRREAPSGTLLGESDTDWLEALTKLHGQPTQV